MAREVEHQAHRSNPGRANRLEFTVDGGLDAPAAAREAVRAGDGAVPGAVREDILLLVTELVTNAVRHAGVGAGQSLRVEVMRRRRRVRVEVAHPGRGFQHEPVPPSPDAAGGWGLVLVDRIADRWGVTNGRRGTSVWFELRSGGTSAPPAPAATRSR